MFIFHGIKLDVSVGNFISMEEQVISRAHRMGATRPIHVETLAMRGTVEEQMLKFLQVYFCTYISLFFSPSVP